MRLPAFTLPTHMRHFPVILLLLVVAMESRGQPPSDLDDALRARIGVIARGGRDSVVLRWAPSKPGVWLIGNRVGYRVERALVGPDGRAGRFTPLLDSAVKPWPYEQWLAYAETHPAPPGSDSADYVAVAYTLSGLFSDDTPARDAYPTDDLAAISAMKNELEMRFGFAMYAVDRSAAAAEGLGLRFVDRTVRAGSVYLYRISLAGSAEKYRIDTGVVTVTALPERLQNHPPITVDAGERRILLQWKANRYYGSYTVERSDDNGATFRRLTPLPIATLRPSLPTDEDVEIYADTAVVWNVLYTYRIYGSTPFADQDLIGEAKGATRDVTPPSQPFLPNPEHINAGTVRVRWESRNDPWTDVAGFRVGRADNDSGPFKSLVTGLLGPATREFLDTTFVNDGANYYVVEAVDTAGNVSWSNSAYVALIDSTPPLAPRWVGGTMDSNGIVTLRIVAGHEKDLMGYRLLRANAADHEFSVVHESFTRGDSVVLLATDTVFHDTVTVQTLTRRVLYQAIALDRNFNESLPSSILIVLRPDVIPPAPPVITDVTVTDTTVLLHFARSPSEDVAHHVVYRTAASSGAWDSLARIAGHDSIFRDRSVEASQTYLYALTAVDSSGLRSDRSVAVSARPYDPGTRPSVRGLVGVHDGNSNVVTLRWEYSDLPEEYWFVVYRAGDDGVLRRHARITSRDRTFVDRQIEADMERATYAVRVVTGSGAESYPDARVGVVIRR